MDINLVLPFSTYYVNVNYDRKNYLAINRGANYGRERFICKEV